MGIDAALWVVSLKIKETAFQRSNISFSLTYRYREILILKHQLFAHALSPSTTIEQDSSTKKLRTIIPLIEALNGMKSHHLSHATSGRFNEIVHKNLEKKFTNFFEVRWYHFFLSRKWFYFFMLKLESQIS